MISHWLGWISFGFCIVLMLKFIVRKTKNTKLNLAFRKIHIPLGILVLITGMLHGLILLIKVSNHIAPIVTGIFTIVLLLFIVATYIFKKKLKKKWMYFHRLGTLALIPFILIHLLLALN